MIPITEYEKAKKRFLKDPSKINFIKLNDISKKLIIHYREYDGTIIEKLNDRDFLIELVYIKQLRPFNKQELNHTAKTLREGLFNG